MKSILSLFVLLAALLATTPAAGQTRVQTKTAGDMKEVLAAAAAQWEKGDYGACVKSLNDAMRIANEKRGGGILTELPDAPDGWTKVERKPAERIAKNPLAQAMGGMIGQMVEQEYRQDGGNGRVTVTLTVDSPVVNMMAIAFSNPAMLEEGSELIEYGSHKAILRSQGGTPRELQIIIGGKHLCAVETRGLSEEQLFAMFDQQAVDRLSGALGG